MKKSILSLAVVAGLVAAVPAQAKVKVKWFGFTQITAAQKSQNKNKDGALAGTVFGADRIRFGFKMKDGPIFAKLQVDANQAGKKTTGQTLPPFIKDAVAGYKLNNAVKISAGQFKTPLGMDFNVSGKKLDITKRGMEKKLVLERAIGVMVSGRKIAHGGFGYDVFMGNNATRGNASFKVPSAAAAGNGNSYVGRVMYNMGRMMHVEAAYGVDEGDGRTNPGQSNYNVYDLGMRVHMGPNTIKAEYIDGRNVKGMSNNNEKVWYIHYGFMLNRHAELVARYYKADQNYQTSTGTVTINNVTTARATSANLTNLYLGANFFLGNSKTNGRVQINYVITTGDDSAGVTQYNGVAKGFTDNTVLAQYQVSF